VSLPQTFKDAIHICRKLGIYRLWIDALCIIQDDLKDWEIESAKMASIYAGASLTSLPPISLWITGHLSEVFRPRENNVSHFK
jgi:hypothetical protein